jgi:poly(hydroxyalkanoate) depolymerase family esterase
MRLTSQMRHNRRVLRQALRSASTVIEGVLRALPLSGLALPDLVPAAPVRNRPASKPAARQREALEPGMHTIEEFGSNPGHLALHLYLPAAPRPRAPLLVLLHGCRQEAVGFARDAGWCALADRLGAPLLLPEQSGANNPGRCFNWFLPTDSRRGVGEAASIRQMVAYVAQRCATDPRRVFIAGLSAGGALSAAMLAAYPEVFAAGAIIAGLPIGSAESVGGAVAAMQHAPTGRSPAQWAALARAVAPAHFAGPWPRISIWQGGTDRTVDPSNAASLVAQWTALHGLAGPATRHERLGEGIDRQVWGGANAAPVEYWSLAGMAHGFPVAGSSRADWILPAGIDATAAIARFWGI